MENGKFGTGDGRGAQSRMIKLSPRLMTVAGFVEKGSNVADIGTDHGFLPVYLAQNGLAQAIIASDKSGGSLKAALRSAEKFGVSDKITFIVAPGLAGIDEAGIDTIVIAGMGGETILKILDDAPWTKRIGLRIIMQPQTKIEKLCSWLRENGYSIQDTAHAHEKSRTYFIVVAAGTRVDSG